MIIPLGRFSLLQLRNSNQHLKREEKLEQLLLKEKEGLEMRWVDGVTFSSKSPFTQHLMRPLSGLLYSMTGKEKASSLRKGTGLNKRENGSLRRFRQTVFASSAILPAGCMGGLSLAAAFS